MKTVQMFSHLFFKSTLLAASVSLVNSAAESEALVVPTAVRTAAAVVSTVAAKVNNVVINTNTTTVANVTTVAAKTVGTTLNSTVLIFARDTASAYSGFSGLNGYAIPYEVVIVPADGITLPTLNSSETVGNYGAFVVLSEVSYEYNGTEGFQSAISAAQWAELYQYQLTFGVRMVRLDVFPSGDSGTEAIGGCCATGIEQLISITNATAFPTAGLKTGAGMSTQGLWHYPANITEPEYTTEIAQFAATTGFDDVSTAAVINDFSGRQQMVFFTGFATDWSPTSNFLQHAWIHWVTRGVYTGFRRVNLNTQVDDMFLETDIYYPVNTTFTIAPSDLAQHVTWMPTVNAYLPPGSDWFMEVGHNGNGNIEDAEDINERKCGVGSIEYADQIDTPLEFVKPPGTGTNLWPETPATYPYTTSCTDLDDLLQWWQKPANLNAFAHVSHTFTHEDQDNATYFDVYRELTWNQAWLKQVGIANATKFSKGLIPPAITGLHNADALRAWVDAGIVMVVGDNTRPILMNPINEMWPAMTNLAINGYEGIQINPRWATNIYYNCPLPDCTVLEWINTSAGKGDFQDLLLIEKATNTRHLLGLHHDAFMFHQANLNYATANETVINGVSKKLSLFQVWVETVTQEMVRLMDWPIISLKHDDFGASFAARMARDACVPGLTYTTNPTAKTLTAITLTTENGNKCSKPIPVTVPGTVTNLQGFTTEQIGSDPLTIWVNMTGSPVTFTLSKPVSLV